MHLLFFISGAVAYFIMQRKSGKQFVGMRFQRLMVPLLFGMLVIVPPQVYMERLTQGFKGNFFDFYPSIFKGIPYPKGNLSWHHLWFILYLFVYDLLAAPLFAWIISPREKKFAGITTWLSQGKRLYLLCLPAILVFTSRILRYPETNDLVNDLAYLPYWYLFVLSGFICISNPLLMNAMERNRRLSLLVAFLSIVSINYLRWNNVEPPDLWANWKAQPLTYCCYTATKLIIPFERSDLSLGGRSLFVSETGWLDIFEELRGDFPDFPRDVAVLEAIDELPSLDPFLLREHMKRRGFDISPTHFEISAPDLAKMQRFVGSEITKLIELAYRDIPRARRATSPASSRPCSRRAPTSGSSLCASRSAWRRRTTRRAFSPGRASSTTSGC